MIPEHSTLDFRPEILQVYGIAWSLRLIYRLFQYARFEPLITTETSYRCELADSYTDTELNPLMDKLLTETKEPYLLC